MSEEVKEISNEEIRKALSAMHRGLLVMQDRLDDHEKVLEKMIMAMDNLASTAVPNGFRQPPKVN